MTLQYVCLLGGHRGGGGRVCVSGLGIHETCSFLGLAVDHGSRVQG